MANDLKIALIGCGRIAGHHCQSISATQGVSIAAVCDLDIEKANAYSEQFDVPAFQDYRQMFNAVPDIDIAAIITPSGMHLEHTLEIIGDFGKHAIVEKPTFMRPGQLQTAFECAEATGKRIFPVFQNQ